jgi:hypothetical protein
VKYDTLFILLGDFCTLVRAGYSTRQAIMAQLLTAIAAFAGTATAIAVSTESWMDDRLILITAGGFVYLAATTILPEVLNGGGHEPNETKPNGMVMRFAKLAALCTGMLFLSMVDWLSGDGHHHRHADGHSHDHLDEMLGEATGSHLLHHTEL